MVFEAVGAHGLLTISAQLGVVAFVAEQRAFGTLALRAVMRAAGLTQLAIAGA